MQRIVVLLVVFVALFSLSQGGISKVFAGGGEQSYHVTYQFTVPQRVEVGRKPFDITLTVTNQDYSSPVKFDATIYFGGTGWGGGSGPATVTPNSNIYWMEGGTPAAQGGMLYYWEGAVRAGETATITIPVNSGSNIGIFEFAQMDMILMSRGHVVEARSLSVDPANTPTQTATPTSTSTSSPTPTATNSVVPATTTATATPTSSNTAIPSTQTAAATSTHMSSPTVPVTSTVVQATATPISTNTAIPSTQTATPTSSSTVVPFTATPTSTPRGLISVSRTQVSVVLNRANVFPDGGYISDDGFEVTSWGAKNIRIRYLQPTGNLYGFITLYAGGLSYGDRQPERIYAYASLPDGIYQGTAVVEYQMVDEGNWTEGARVDFAIRLEGSLPATSTPNVTNTPVATSTLVPTETPTSTATNTSLPTSTPARTSTPTPVLPGLELDRNVVSLTLVKGTDPHGYVLSGNILTLKSRKAYEYWVQYLDTQPSGYGFYPMHGTLVPGTDTSLVLFTYNNVEQGNKGGRVRILYRDDLGWHENDAPVVYWTLRVENPSPTATPTRTPTPQPTATPSVKPKAEVWYVSPNPAPVGRNTYITLMGKNLIAGGVDYAVFRSSWRLSCFAPVPGSYGFEYLYCTLPSWVNAGPGWIQVHQRDGQTSNLVILNVW